MFVFTFYFVDYISNQYPHLATAAILPTMENTSRNANSQISNEVNKRPKYVHKTYKIWSQKYDMHVKKNLAIFLTHSFVLKTKKCAV